MRRRDFLKRAAIPPAALAAAQGCAGPKRQPSPGTGGAKVAALARREYGRTGIRLSVIGFGGYMLNGLEQGKANRVVAEAIERGVNYFDVAPTYGDAELRLGPALEPYRKDVFLACKTTKRDRAGAEAELTQSLKRLRTDHVDLYQLHALTKVDKDVDAVFAKGGAMEAFIEAKRSGRARHLGFSAHSEEAALAALERYPFDSILFPVNFACYAKGGFGPRVVAKARARGAAILAIKAMALQRHAKGKGDAGRKQYPNCWYQPISDPAEAALALRFALGEPVTSCVPPADASLFELALRLVADLRPLSASEKKGLWARASGLTPVFSTVKA